MLCMWNCSNPAWPSLVSHFTHFALVWVTLTHFHFLHESRDNNDSFSFSFWMWFSLLFILFLNLIFFKFFFLKKHHFEFAVVLKLKKHHFEFAVVQVVTTASQRWMRMKGHHRGCHSQKLSLFPAPVPPHRPLPPNPWNGCPGKEELEGKMANTRSCGWWWVKLV